MIWFLSISLVVLLVMMFFMWSHNNDLHLIIRELESDLKNLEKHHGRN
jgi:hypothetical protein